MKILLVAVNAKFTHMNPAVYSIRAYSREYAEYMEIAEYTINQYPKDVLADIYERHPDVIGFSCYIWNIRFIGEILADIKKVLPEAMVFLGGPEVSYNSDEVLDRYQSVDGVFCGEGEYPWREAAGQILENGRITGEIAGLILRNRQNISYKEDLQLSRTEENSRVRIDRHSLDDIPFIFDDLSIFENRMLYYETSRGCPFRCSYCLSSVEKHMRFRSLEKVFPELQFFLDHNVRIVKFIDRTFNADHKHAMAIWKYLKEHDNGVSRFHFEIEADLLTDEEIDFLLSVRHGLFQLEIGVQSVNRKTLSEINRFADTDRIRDAVIRLAEGAEHMPLHVDLIAGLPYEDLESFRSSFNEVYSWGADELQLGFLKVLHGTVMEERKAEYGLICESEPPYEALSTRWLSYDDILFLKKIEEQLERYANSGGFRHTLKAFVRLFDSPFDMFEFIASYYGEHMDRFRKQSRISAYEMLRDIIRSRLAEISENLAEDHFTEYNIFDELMILDLYEKEKLKTRPAFLGDDRVRQRREREYIREYRIEGNVHIEFFEHDIEAFEKNGSMILRKMAVIFCYEDNKLYKVIYDQQ